MCYSGEIAGRIKKLCISNKISSNKLLLACKINTSFITDLKKGRIPSVDKIVKIADYFNVSTDYLLLGKENNLKNKKENKKMNKNDYNLLKFIYNKGIVKKNDISSHFENIDIGYNQRLIELLSNNLIEDEREYTIEEIFNKLNEKIEGEYAVTEIGELAISNYEAELSQDEDEKELIDIFIKLDKQGKAFVKAEAYKQLNRVKEELAATKEKQAI